MPGHHARRLWIGGLLTVIGLLGHLLAAHAIGGSTLAYVHHVFGFFIILLVSGALIVGLGWRFWRERRDITVLMIGAVQALIGLLVYLGDAAG